MGGGTYALNSKSSTVKLLLSDFPWDLELSNPRISRRKRELSGPRPLSGVQADVCKSAV